ncbi:hypothetical protein B0T18DRAFT_416826 [Schizothecium vesticola]|uniref:Uncharacterized protein n=1 Tax=Schizothecium vesticola TaxID=314040 RepID=A0AA40K3D8_9PEZI|nr:hypothetical protein B0T18DRAFT_416826 [Schizothecium vesticola]
MTTPTMRLRHHGQSIRQARHMEAPGGNPVKGLAPGGSLASVDCASWSPPTPSPASSLLPDMMAWQFSGGIQPRGLIIAPWPVLERRRQIKPPAALPSKQPHNRVRRLISWFLASQEDGRRPLSNSAPLVCAKVRVAGHPKLGQHQEQLTIPRRQKQPHRWPTRSYLEGDTVKIRQLIQARQESRIMGSSLASWGGLGRRFCEGETAPRKRHAPSNCGRSKIKPGVLHISVQSLPQKTQKIQLQPKHGELNQNHERTMSWLVW